MYTAKLLPKIQRAKPRECRIVSLLDHPSTPFVNVIIMTKKSMAGRAADGYNVARKHIPTHIHLHPNLSVCTTVYKTAAVWGADPAQHHLHVFAEGITASLLIFD